MSADWIVERDTELAVLTEQAHRLLVGREVASVVAKSHSPACDATNVLLISFTDGTSVEIHGGYGGYTGNSCDEYVELIDVREAVS